MEIAHQEATNGTEVLRRTVYRGENDLYFWVYEEVEALVHGKRETILQILIPRTPHKRAATVALCPVPAAAEPPLQYVPQEQDSRHRIPA